MMKIKCILHTVIRFRKYIQPRVGPIQCSKCFLHGHGEKNCHMAIKCANCGENHKLEDCALEKPVCCNCKGEHTATFADCPSRKNFIEIRKSLSSRTANKKYTQQRPQLQTERFDIEAMFPALPQPKKNPLFNWGSTTHHMPPAPANSDDSSLFSIDEIMQITHDVLTSLKSCKTKMQQFETITRLAVKYVYGAT